ncbi:exodeoxyribonuclease VII large subunit [Candidatus Saccharibacteria bacterium]|nr:exodeoxyribonuclease VII large subunit [Candidatus Saccharibacteria bacterium]
MENNPFTPTEFVAVANQTLEYAYSGVTIVGEVASFKVNQGKWVFFDLKDDETCVPCFMTLWSMRQPLEDGMKVIIRGVPKLTKWGKFSVTVSQVAPVGEGSLKKAYELLKKKLTDEGLFDPAKKRAIPPYLNKIGVISSLQAAGYADFIKIINARWGGMKVITAHTQVQGLDAPDQIIRALDYFNERSEVQVIVILRGGGSKDDLSCFNDEKLVRAVASSKIPVVTGIGHEIDESLVDLAADLAASTPSNAAELLTPDRKQEIMKVRQKTLQIGEMLTMQIDRKITDVQKNITDVFSNIKRELEVKENDLRQRMRLLEALNPEVVLKQGYAILSGKVSPGSVVKITTFDSEIITLVQEIIKRSKNG